MTCTCLPYLQSLLDWYSPLGTCDGGEVAHVVAPSSKARFRKRPSSRHVRFAGSGAGPQDMVRSRRPTSHTYLQLLFWQSQVITLDSDRLGSFLPLHQKYLTTHNTKYFNQPPIPNVPGIAKMGPEESETPYFVEAFYSSPIVRLKYEAPANDAAIKEAYRLACAKELDALTTQDRQQISKAVSVLDRTVLQISRKLKPEWVTILLTHRMLNPDVSFPWWSTVEPYTSSSPLDRDPITRYDPSCYFILMAS